MDSAQIHRKRKFFNVLLWTAALLAVLSMIGLLVSLVLLGLNKEPVLSGILCGSFFLGAVLCGGLGFLFFGITDKLARAELDALEREDDPNSFFVGEGTLATLGSAGLSIHGGAEEKRLNIPYPEIRFHSVCTRRRPRERGEWSVILEIPARYFTKNVKKEEPNVLVQTSGKERLYARLRELDLPLLGEQPAQGEDRKFRREKKFTLADPEKRIRALVLIGFGVLLLIAGILLAALWNATVGSLVIVLGGYVGIRALVALVRARSEFSVYEEGIFYREPSGMDNVFLKWEEFSGISVLEKEDKRYIRVECPYGAYDFPMFEDACGYLKERRPDKCAK